MIPLEAGTHSATATSAAAVNVTCPVGTKAVEVSSNSDFHFKRAAGAVVTDTYCPAGGP